MLSGVTILIPTFKNVAMLKNCLKSMQGTTDDASVVIVNNGSDIFDMIELTSIIKNISIINPGKNLGWAGGINYALQELIAQKKCPDYVILMNDDTLILPGDTTWIHKMYDMMNADYDIAAIGPSSNYVMGIQNMMNVLPMLHIDVNFLIGFCVMMRAKYFINIGMMDEGLTGGDDFDWSLRFKDEGYKLVCARDVFVYHHGCQTGVRVRQDWGSEAMQKQVNDELIAKHGIEKFKALWVPAREYVKELCTPMINKGIKRPYVLTSSRNLCATPLYAKRSAGVKAFDILGQELQKRGYEVEVVDTGGTSPRAEALIAKNAIAVYHEGISFNYLKAKSFVPYILGWWEQGGAAGVVALPSRYKFYYSMKFQTAHYMYSAKKSWELTLCTFERDLFNLKDVVEPRTIEVVYVGKGDAKALDQIKFTNRVDITNHWPTERKEVAALFKKAKFLYTVDGNSAISMEARLCGCPSIFVPNSSYSEADLKSVQHTLNGFATNLSQAEIDRAVVTIPLLAGDVDQIYGREQEHLDNFVEVTQNM